MSNTVDNAKISLEGGRNYGIDLLRILSMFFVVVLHILNRTKLNDYYQINSLGYIFVHAIRAFTISAVNVYAMISGFVLLNSKFKLKRILQLYIEVFFFIALSHIIIIISNGEWNGIKEFIKELFFCLPLRNNEIWYFNAYFLLFFSFPLLNALIKNLTKRQFIFLFIIIAFFICIVSFYIDDRWYFINGYSFIWIATLYFIGAYFKKFGLLNLSSLKCFVIYVAISLAILLGLIINNLLPPFHIDTIGDYLNLKYNVYEYASIFVVMQAVFLFNACAKIQIKHNIFKNILLFFSPLTFGVYIIHESNYGRILISEYFSFLGGNSVWLLIPLVIGCSILIFMVCSVIEWLRRILFKFIGIDKLTNRTGDFIQNKISAFAEKKSI